MPTPSTKTRERKILVTGGAGFIGSWLTELLRSRGDLVVVLDDLSTGSIQNLESMRGDAGFAFVRGSTTDPDAVASACAGVDAVFHLAGAAGVRLLAEQPAFAMGANLHGTAVVLTEAARRGVPVLLASSSEVYGSGVAQNGARFEPFREDDALQPGSTKSLRGGYACAKAMGEWLALAHAQESDLAVVVARLFNTVGPRQSGQHGMVLPRFAAQALRGDPLTVYGDGAQTRCFAHVRDVAAALADLLLDGNAFGETVNVGADREVSVAALAELVRTAASSRSPVAFTPFDEVFPSGFEDVSRRVPNLTLARRLLGRDPAPTNLATIVGDVVREVAAEVARGQSSPAHAMTSGTPG